MQKLCSNLFHEKQNKRTKPVYTSKYPNFPEKKFWRHLTDENIYVSVLFSSLYRR